MMVFRKYNKVDNNKELIGLGIYSNNGDSVIVRVNENDDRREFHNIDEYIEFVDSFKRKIIILLNADDFAQDEPTKAGSAWEKVQRLFKDDETGLVASAIV